MITNIFWKVKAKEQRSIRTKEKTQEEEKEDNWYVISKVLKKNFHGE